MERFLCRSVLVSSAGVWCVKPRYPMVLLNIVGMWCTCVCIHVYMCVCTVCMRTWKEAENHNILG